MIEINKTEKPLAKPIDQSKVSDHLSLEDLTVCLDPRIRNFPTASQRKNLAMLANEIYEPLVKKYGDVFTVTEAFKCRKYVARQKGNVKNNPHMLGQAITFTVTALAKVSNYEVFSYIYHNLPYDFLIWECGVEYPAFDNESPPWITVTLKKNNNHMKAIRKYFDDDTGKLKSKRIFR